MKKLLQLNVTANWGSTGKIAEDIGKMVMSHGWESHIAYGRYFNQSSSNLIKIGKTPDVYAHYALSRALNREGLESVKPTKYLLQQIKTLTPDVIHIHNIHDHWLNYPLLFEGLKEVSVPVVWTFHDCWGFTGDCGYFIESGCERWKTGCKGCSKHYLLHNRNEKNLLLKLSLLENLKDRLTIVSVSRWLDSLVGESVLKDFNRAVIYNGIDTNVFRPKTASDIRKRYNLSDKKIVLGVSNVWDSRKGLNDFVEIRKLLDNRFVIILVGLNEKQIKQLPEGILGIERTQNISDLVDLYSEADVVASLSKAETFGLTLIEGQACGTPSVGYAATALNEVITDISGLKVQPGNIRAVADAIKVISDGTSFSSSAIRQNVIDNFNKDNQYRKYMDLYESMISVN